MRVFASRGLFTKILIQLVVETRVVCCTGPNSVSGNVVIYRYISFYNNVNVALFDLLHLKCPYGILTRLYRLSNLLSTKFL
jgi:hypothetical protein